MYPGAAALSFSSVSLWCSFVCVPLETIYRPPRSAISVRKDFDALRQFNVSKCVTMQQTLAKVFHADYLFSTRRVDQVSRLVLGGFV